MRPFLSPASAFVSSILLVAVCMSTPVNAEPDAAHIQLGLRRLGVVGRVLYVAAHPDDENTALLAYLQNDALVRTAYLSMTRGDGGQNLIGSEQGPELGLIRTQELLAARRLDGAEQFFTRARDFGFSKSPDETMRIWGREAVLADVVSVVRRFRPDVIITRFPAEKTDTHGHHTASAMLAVEAFRAAADPKFHPEQLVNGVTPWQARRLVWNRSLWGAKADEDLSAFAKLDVGGFNPLLGLSTGELAADSRSMHKSQGFGVARTRGPIVEYFKVLDEVPAPKVKPKAPEGPLTELDVTWARFGSKGTAHLRTLVDRAARAFDATKPHASLPALIEIDRALDAATDVDADVRAQKKRETAGLIVACAGLYFEVTAATPEVAPGQRLPLVASVIDRSPAAVTLDALRFPFAEKPVVIGKAVPAAAPDAAGAALDTSSTVLVPRTTPTTTPYWLDAPPEAGLYRVADARSIGAPENEPTLRVEFDVTVAGHKLTVTRAASYKWTDPVMGERSRPVEITPAVSVRPDAGVLMFPDAGSRALTVRLTAGAPSVAGVVKPTAPAGWTVEPPSAPFSLATIGSEATLSFHVQPVGKPAPGTLRVVAEVGGVVYARGVIHIEHAHIPVQTWLADADVRLVPVALATGGKRIGYIPGPGDEVPASLRRVGYDVTLLDDSALTAAALARFDAVVTGVRAFNTSDRLRAAHAALMAYVEGGGTLVVQYNTNNRLAPLSGPIGPWPFEIGHERVTDETATATFLSATHPAVTTPNALTARDFDGWIQERGLYFAQKWDPRYQTVLSMHDPDEPALAGSVLWAHVGRGTFVYTGLAFFRQLPAGVPGAFRLFANLLAGGNAHRGP
jgi:LmbE family N-acetylglucosaminyl deacetylase